jgi:hypothetical protein
MQLFEYGEWRKCKGPNHHPSFYETNTLFESRSWNENLWCNFISHGFIDTLLSQVLWPETVHTSTRAYTHTHTLEYRSNNKECKYRPTYTKTLAWMFIYKFIFFTVVILTKPWKTGWREKSPNHQVGLCSTYSSQEITQNKEQIGFPGTWYCENITPHTHYKSSYCLCKRREGL